MSSSSSRLGVRERLMSMVAPAEVARRGWRLVSVFVLVLAVMGMHSMGAGHHGVASPTSHSAHQAAAGIPLGANDHRTMPVSGSHHDPAAADAASSSDISVHADSVAPCLACSTLSAGSLGAMCLAVMSTLLGWVLLRALRQIVRGRAALTISLWSRLGLPLRSPLRRMALSPIEVCVLRT